MENTHNGKVVSRMGVIRKILLVFCLLNFLFCCSDKEDEPIELNVYSVEKFQFSDSTYSIQIENSTNHEIHFTFNINDLFPLDYELIEEQIDRLAIQKNIHSEKSAWIYVNSKTFHARPLTNENWQHNPLLFLNSIGGGLCDDRASVLAKLWKEQGDSSRIIGIVGHVVPEVFKDGKWHMYDPDKNVYYCSENNIPKSVAQLEVSNDSILVANCGQSQINPVFQFKNPISKYLTSLYKSRDNNDVTQWHLNYSEISNEFVLPPYSALEIIHDNESDVTNLIVKLSSKSKGTLKIPLVPFDVSGKIEISFNDSIINFDGSSTLFPKDQLYTKLEINDVDGEGEIRYLINPKLSFIKSKNKLEINSTDSLDVIITNENSSSPKVLFKKERLFFDEKSILHQGFLSSISEYNGEVIDEQFLKEKYLLFLENDNKITMEEKDELMLQFDNDLEKVYATLNTEELKILKDQYPKSIFYLFLASRYRKLDYIFKILN